ncbi:unnamed protein product [Prorocentrum cordatum]|uniref:Uncharacterized protein n=1 Tax=Prorocentrum cordatum TaxID=2364126 RepID=A0ABN9WED6_9DINO|nr:unnamed protein product [Polarella glacialis]
MANCEPMCHGTGVVYQYGNQYRAGRNAICYLLEKLGGLQIRFSTLTATAKPAKRATEWDKKQEGHRYIEKKGPKSNNSNQFMEFADKEINDPQSKIYGWEEPRVVQALRNHASGRINAKHRSVWVLTLKDFEPWFINEVLVKILPTLHRNGVLWIGKTRVGKSTTSKTLAFLMSMLEIDALEGDDREGAPEPSIVTANHFDFFKGEPVERAPPAVFDDGGLHKQDASVLKAFLNPSEEDSTLWARWGSSTFAPGAPRQAVNNSYDNALEKRMVADWRQGKLMVITIQQLMALIAPSLKQITEEEDMKALLARSHVVVTTDTRVHFCLASDEFPEDGVVPFYTYSKKSKPDLFNYSPEARACCGRHKDDPTSPNNYPSDFKEKAEWSLNFAKRLMCGEQVPTVSTTRGTSLFGEPVHRVQPEAAPPPAGAPAAPMAAEAAPEEAPPAVQPEAALTPAGAPAAPMAAEAAPEEGPPAKRAKAGAQGGRAAPPDPFAGGFRRDRLGGDRGDYEGEEEPPLGAPAQEIERLWGLHQAGGITLAKFNVLKRSAISEGFKALQKGAPAKKEDRSAKREQMPRAPIKRDPTEGAAKREVFEAKPVDKETIQGLFPGSGSAEVGRRLRGVIGIARSLTSGRLSCAPFGREHGCPFWQRVTGDSFARPQSAALLLSPQQAPWRSTRTRTE